MDLETLRRFQDAIYDNPKGGVTCIYELVPDFILKGPSPCTASCGHEVPWSKAAWSVRDRIWLVCIYHEGCEKSIPIWYPAAFLSNALEVKYPREVFSFPVS